MTDLLVEPTGESNLGNCDCCGQRTRAISGLVHGEDQAAYFVHWTPGKVVELGARWDVVIGKWGEGTTGADRVAVTLEFRHTESGPGFMIVDGREFPDDDMKPRSLRREEVIGTSEADAAFRVVDAVWLQDPRVQEIRDAAA